MKGDQKYYEFKKRLAALICIAAMVVLLIPAAVLADDQKEGTKDTDLIHPDKPSGYDENDDSNPFGYAKGQAFRIYEDSELFTYYSHWSKSRKAKVAKNRS